MIIPVTKEFFKKKVGRPEFTVVEAPGKDTIIDGGKNKIEYYHSSPTYYYVPEKRGYFVYLTELGKDKIIIPQNNPEPLDPETDIFGKTVDWNNWELEKTELVKYSLNEFNRISHNEINIVSNLVDKWVKPTQNYIESWLLRNTVTGEEIRFSTLYENSYSNGEVTIAIEELLQLPCPIKSCSMKIGFIQNLITNHWEKIKWTKKEKSN